MKKQEAIETICINDVEYVRKDSVKQLPPLGERSLIRTRNAGVWVGELVERDAIDTVLKNANRIWRWRGANTLSEVAISGVNRSEHTRIAKMVEEVALTTSDTCEIIPVAKGVDLAEVWND